MEVWRLDVSVVTWRHGGIERWKCSDVEACRYGGGMGL